MEIQVTPYGGVWIEILLPRLNYEHAIVTPYGGVWIEILEIGQAIEVL